ncbi:hypothetical protein [Flavobacterium sp.]|uniref:hypothetical protein n=1 Tax=Flavobacterium sp. TaxID=239 RepID=UPI00375188B2
MQRFAIYHKSKRFHPTTNQVFYAFNVVAISIWIVLEKIIKTEKFSRILGFAVAISWLVALLAMLIGKLKSPPLRGKLDGFISFNNDNITVEKEVFNLSDIKIIKITNDDYYGKNKYLGRGNFNASYSNGVDNELLIELNTSKVKLYNFEIYNSADFQKIKSELIAYYLQDKLEFSILTYLLGLEKTGEISDFKDYCKRTAAKSGLNQ